MHFDITHDHFIDNEMTDMTVIKSMLTYKLTFIAMAIVRMSVHVIENYSIIIVLQ